MKEIQYQSIYPFILILILISPLLWMPKEQSLLLLNGFHSPFKDWALKKVTWLGEGFMICCCIVLLLFLKIRWWIVFVFGLLLHVILIQVNKQFLFNEVLRPLGYFESIEKEYLLHIVDGIRVNHKTSFPSGHTTGATFAASFIALIMKNKQTSFVLAFIAISIGFSRVYLAQHFIIDIYFGFLFGTLSSVIAAVIVKKIQSRYWWMDMHLIIVMPGYTSIGFDVLKQSFHKNLKSSPKY